MASKPSPTAWHCGRFLFEFTDQVGQVVRPLVMGILNTTPDSFSDGGKYASRDAALHHAEEMIANGVDIIDIGGESTRPGATPISASEEIDRVLPVIETLVDCGVALSIDTYKAETMKVALDMGVDCVNDIWALRQKNTLPIIKKSNCGVVLMHMQGDPKTMQIKPDYHDVLTEVDVFLQDRCIALESVGITRERIAIDPGFGFGKSLENNLMMLAHFHRFVESGYPVLAGISRKSMIGKITGRESHERLAGSIAAAVMAAEQGALLIRTHDVSETSDALKVWQATKALAL